LTPLDDNSSDVETPKPKLELLPKPKLLLSDVEIPRLKLVLALLSILF
ncbi:3783_t:CDS:1, partial [Rhizophagus irregularis]